VYIDGEVKTTLSAGSATVSGLSEGEHTLGVEASGYKRYNTTIEVTPGEAVEVEVELVRKGGPTGGGERPGKTSRVLFWTSVVATGASITAFTVTGLQVRSLEDDKQEQFEILVANGADTSGSPTDSKGDFTDVCGVADANMAVQGAAELAATCDDGRSKALLTNLFIGTSVATALAASYFYYKGYIQPKSSKEREPSFSVTPTIGSNVVGAGLEIQF
jgi:hypothetical protein